MANGLSTIFSKLVGSVSDITFFYNRYGQIIARSRVIPSDPATSYQLTARNRLKAAVLAWQGLTPEQRLSWEDYAQGTPWVNSLGLPCHITGMHFYIAVRCAGLLINPTMNTALLNTASCIPGMFVTPEAWISSCAGSGSGAGFVLNLKNPHPTDNMRVGVHISLPQNTSINYWTGPYDSSSYLSTSAILPGNSTFISYKTLTLGKRYFMRLRAWNATLKTTISTPTHIYADAASCV